VSLAMGPVATLATGFLGGDALCPRKPGDHRSGVGSPPGASTVGRGVFIDISPSHWREQLGSGADTATLGR
jgi:hypothetical protein